DVIWIDARSVEEYEAGHYSGAIHVDESNWDSGLVVLMNRWLEAHRPIVIYCGSKDCNSSRRLADRLRQALPEGEIYSLKGGSEVWTK
ncbi:MAG: rhodanese-like domain-containing protein, partial [Verrucomicrobiota bacterium]|nr:rhodanese-like domain-containing protein [Verrucomicrobiota bacterium]